MAKKFGDVMQWYLDSMGVLGIAHSTQKSRFHVGKKLIADLGGFYLTHGHLRNKRKLDRMAVREFRLKMKQDGYADATILQHLAIGSAAINAAELEKDWELPNPFKRAGKGLKANVRHREVSQIGQAEGLLKMRQPYRDMTEVTFRSALRPSEVCWLARERVVDGRVLFKEGVTTQDGGQKSKVAGRVPLGRRAREIVDRQPVRGPWVFSHPDGRRIAYMTWYKEFKRAFGEYSPHDGRHTCLARVRRELGQIDPAQALGRHRRRETTEKHYAPVSEELAVLAVNAVDN